MARDALFNAAARVADGELLDWGAVSSTLKSDEERAVADELVLVAKIAAGHRQLHELLPLAPDTPRQLLPDRTRWGHLDLLNIVGSGSYGTVYRAWDTRLERLVALKLFRGAHNPEVVMQEGRMLARVRHENVVTVYGADVIDGVAGLWMELVHGRTLDQIIKADGPMTASEAAEIGVDVASALAAVHAASLLHCDVKAQNVVREKEGRVVLMDLGAGQALVPDDVRDADHLSDVAGTPRYMAPELLHRGTEATRATDIYSFGVLLYYLVTARFPVNGTSFAELKQAHLDGRVTPIDEARPDLPAGYVSVVSQALDPDPARRQATATDVQSALEPIAEPPSKTLFTRSAGLTAAVALGVGLLAFVLLRPFVTPPTPLAPETRSIAVLPIKNFTGDTTKAYVADGLTESLVSNLARLPSLRVQSFASVTTVRDSSDPPAVTAKRLGVQLLLAGSLTEADTRVRLTFQLIDAAGFAIWGGEFNADRSGILGVQANIIKVLATQIGITVPPEENERLMQATLTPEAEDSYLHGLAQALSLPAGADQAVASFRRTTELAPLFAPAWGELALSEMFLLDVAPSAERTEHIEAIRALADRAINLDPMSGRGYTALGTLEFYYDWDLDKAEQTFRAGLERAPSDGAIRQRFAMLLAARNKLVEAIDVGRNAKRLEPLVPIRSTSLGTLYYYARRYDEAVAEMQRALTLNPRFSVAHFGLGRVYTAQGRIAEALSAFQLALSSARYPEWLAEYARVLTIAGRRGEAAKVFRELEALAAKGQAPYPDYVAHQAVVEGDRERAFAILEDAVNQRSLGVLWLAVDPRVDPLRDDPRFARLLTRIDPH